MFLFSQIICPRTCFPATGSGWIKSVHAESISPQKVLATFCSIIFFDRLQSKTSNSWKGVSLFLTTAFHLVLISTSLYFLIQIVFKLFAWAGMSGIWRPPDLYLLRSVARFILSRFPPQIKLNMIFSIELIIDLDGIGSTVIKYISCGNCCIFLEAATGCLPSRKVKCVRSENSQARGSEAVDFRDEVANKMYANDYRS